MPHPIQFDAAEDVLLSAVHIRYSFSAENQPSAGGDAAVKTGLAVIPGLGSSKDASAEGDGTAQSEILLVAVLSAVLIVLLARYSVRLSRSVAQPVVDLSRRAEDVIGGDLTVREPVRSET